MSEEPDIPIEFVELPYPFLETNNAKLRCFIAEHYLNAEIDGAILVANMEAIYQWILRGKAAAKARKPQLVKP